MYRDLFIGRDRRGWLKWLAKLTVCYILCNVHCSSYITCIIVKNKFILAKWFVPSCLEKRVEETGWSNKFRWLWWWWWWWMVMIRHPKNIENEAQIDPPNHRKSTPERPRRHPGRSTEAPRRLPEAPGGPGRPKINFWTDFSKISRFSGDPKIDVLNMKIMIFRLGARVPT